MAVTGGVHRECTLYFLSISLNNALKRDLFSTPIIYVWPRNSAERAGQGVMYVYVELAESARSAALRSIEHTLIS